MKKRNLILAAAVAMAFAASAANAATAVSTTAVKYAAEQFSGTTPYAAVIAPTINIVSSTSIPAGSTVTVALELTGATWGVAPVGHATNTPGAGVVSTAALGGVDTTAMVTIGSTLTGSTAAAAGNTSCTATATANNSNVVRLSMTTTAAIGIGGTIATITTPTINACGLSSTSATVTGTATIYVGSPTFTVGSALPTTGTLEAGSAATSIGTSAAGVTVVGAAGTAGKIDLTATPVASAFTGAFSVTEVDLGTVTATDGTAKLVTAGNAAYNIAAKGTTTMVTTVAAPAGFFAALRTTGVIALKAGTCGGATLSTSATFGTNALAAAATSVSIPAATPVSATVYHVCMTIPASSTSSVALVPGTPTVAATLGGTAAQDSADTLAATNLWALAYNGSQVDVTNYVPAGVGAGWQQYLRVVNTGSVAATISAAVIDETTGVAGTSAAVISNMAPGAAMTLTAQDIEAAVGTITPTARPRIRVTGPTNGLTVQNMLFTPNGGFTNNSSSQ